MNTLKWKITSQLSNIWKKWKMVIAVSLIALMPILNSGCGPEREVNQKKEREIRDSIWEVRQKEKKEQEALEQKKHHIKFVVFYTNEIIDTLSYDSEHELKYISGRGTNEVWDNRWLYNHGDRLFKTTAPIKVLENR